MDYHVLLGSFSHTKIVIFVIRLTDCLSRGERSEAVGCSGVRRMMVMHQCVHVLIIPQAQVLPLRPQLEQFPKLKSYRDQLLCCGYHKRNH